MFSWNIPYVPSDNEAICSPAFAKWGRQWRITFEKRGNQSMFGLKYTQGVGPMHLAVSYVRVCAGVYERVKKYILGNKVISGVQRFHALKNLYLNTKTLQPFLIFYLVGVCSSINFN